MREEVQEVHHVVIVMVVTVMHTVVKVEEVVMPVSTKEVCFSKLKINFLV